MGFTNLDEMTFDSGLKMTNCYISMTSGPPPFPSQAESIRLSWTYDPTTGAKSYHRDLTVYVYGSKALKDAGCEPIQTTRLDIPANAYAQGVLTSVYSNLNQSMYTHTTADDKTDMTT